MGDDLDPAAAAAEEEAPAAAGPQREFGQGWNDWGLPAPQPTRAPANVQTGDNNAGPWTMPLDRGMRANNPGNLGISPALGPEAEHSYNSPEEGIQAIGHQLDRYASGATTGSPLNTINDIVSTYSPSSENDTNSLIQRASAHMGLDPHVPMDLTDPYTRRAMVEATLLNEHGGKMPVTQQVLDRALPVGDNAWRAQPDPAGQAVNNQPRSIGPFKNQWDAYEGAPANRDAYSLLKDGNGNYNWSPDLSRATTPSPPGPSPYFNQQDSEQAANQQLIRSPQTYGGPINTLMGNTGAAFWGSIAHFLDLPAYGAEKALDAISAGTGMKRLDLHFGTPVADAMNRMGFNTEPTPSSPTDPQDWARTLGIGIGSGLGMALPMMLSGGLSAAVEPTLAGETASLAQKIAPTVAKGTGFEKGATLGAAAGEASLGAGAGLGQQEAHELYTGATGRSGDLGDVLAQLAGGSALNAVRLPVMAGLESTAGTAMSRAWSGAKASLGKGADFEDTPAPELEQALDPATGTRIADAVLSKQLSSKLDEANRQAAALSPSAPGDETGYMADRSSLAKQAVASFMDKSDQDVQAHYGDVNSAMPRDFSKTNGMFDAMKHDYDNGLHITKGDFPDNLRKFLGSSGELNNIDSFGRGWDLYSGMNRAIEGSLTRSGTGPAGNESLINSYQKLRNQLRDDLMADTQGATPNEVDSFQQLKSLSDGRQKLMESPEMISFLKSGDSTALEKLVKQGTAGADAVKVLLGAAQTKYGSGGLLDAAKDVVRQKYANTVAPNGYVSLADHNAFMNRYGALWQHPEFDDMKNQFNAAAQAEGDVNATVGFGKPGGFGNTAGMIDRRQDLTENYLNSPMETVLRHLENVSDASAATGRVLSQLAEGANGSEAVKGFAHAVAGKTLTQGQNYISANPGIFKALDEVIPANSQGQTFTDRALQYTDPTTQQGIARALANWGLSYLGARAAGKLGGNMGSELLMAQHGAKFANLLGDKTREQLLNVSSANIVDPAAGDAWGRIMSGKFQAPQQIVADKLLLHSYVPGMAIGNLPTQQQGTGLPGSPPANGKEDWMRILGIPTQ